jgi:hypothetical protein
LLSICVTSVAGDDATAPIDQDGPAGTVLPQRALERGASAIGAAICVLIIGDEITETERLMG